MTSHLIIMYVIILINSVAEIIQKYKSAPRNQEFVDAVQSDAEDSSLVLNYLYAMLKK